MIRFTQGNLFDADVEAVVNTVNTVGVMGKGIALMFKERFPENTRAYAAACKRGKVQVGRMFATEANVVGGPRWIVNFPTKRHWRHPSKLEWIRDGLVDLRRFVKTKGIRSIALPPLGAGNGKLDWADVRPLVEAALGDLGGVEVVVYEPTRAYHNVSKKSGVTKLTPARALVVEMIRRYEVLGLDCSILEVQKLAWVLDRAIRRAGLKDPLKLTFGANIYGPYADALRHVLDKLDGSYLHSDKRLADALPVDLIHVAPDSAPKVRAYLSVSGRRPYLEAVEQADRFIDGFQSPLGMEVLATVGWLTEHEGVEPTLEAVKAGIAAWPAGKPAADRKQRLFGNSLLTAAIDRLTSAT